MRLGCPPSAPSTLTSDPQPSISGYADVCAYVVVSGTTPSVRISGCVLGSQGANGMGKGLELMVVLFVLFSLPFSFRFRVLIR